MTIIELKAAISREPARSAWAKGVKEYALELIDNIPGDDLNAQAPASSELKAILLNGAKDWDQYSWGGCALIYDSDIAERLCSPSELKRCKGGDRRPSAREEWLDTQARALSHAAHMIMRLARAE